MNEELAKKIYLKLIQNGGVEDPVIKNRAVAAFNRWSDDTGNAVALFLTEFLAAVDETTQQERFKQVNSLLQALQTEAGEAARPVGEYAGWLCLWNGWFRQKQLKLKMPPISAAAAMAMLVEINNAGWDDDAGFKQFCATTTNPHREIYDMREAFRSAGLPLTDVYTAMHFLQQHALPISKLKTSTATDIHYLSLQAPPLTAFGGFTGWGPGNNGNIPDNKKNHFLKHILDAHPAEDLPWQGECAVWWRKLDIKLLRQAAEAAMSGILFNLVKAHFPAEATGALPFDKVEIVIGLVKANGGWPIPLRDRLIADYQDKYTDTAITLSQSMTGILVHTDAQGGKVMMMGLNGDFFLGGRMAGSTLGLSTCFVPKPTVDKGTLNQAFKIWQVSPL